MTAIIGVPILIAVIICSYKIIASGFNVKMRNEAKDHLLRLCFCGVAIAAAPLFVKFLLFLNNSLVRAMVVGANGSIDDLIGNSLVSNVSTGNAIATSIVIAIFAYLFVYINIKFIVRQITLIVFTVFTPIVAVTWVINKRAIGSSIWFGEIIVNAFMQFIYAFLFLIFLDFSPTTSGWAISLLWAMMLLPLGEALSNTLRNLISRVAGVSNEEMSRRAIGLPAAIGHSTRALAFQFKSGSEGQESGTGFMSRLLNKKPEDKQTSPIKTQGITTTPMQTSPINKKSDNKSPEDAKNIINNNDNKDGFSKMSNIKKAYNVGKEFLNLGMYGAEGRNFRSSYDKERTYNRPNINNSRIDDAKKREEDVAKIEMTSNEKDI